MVTFSYGKMRDDNERNFCLECSMFLYPDNAIESLFDQLFVRLQGMNGSSTTVPKLDLKNAVEKFVHPLFFGNRKEDKWANLRLSHD